MSNEPLAALENHAADTPAVCRWAVAGARYWFLRALQQLTPFFWETLHRDVWQSPEPELALGRWLAQMHITDEWFIQAIKDTLKEWSASPDSPGAQLAPGHLWFYYSDPLGEWRIAPFAPIVAGHPAYLKSREEFAERMRNQFEQQLAAYMSGEDYVGGFWEEPANRRRDIEWTVARFVGVPIPEIIKEWLDAKAAGLSHNNKDMQQTVYRSVRRFADEIGLTLPSYKNSYGTVYNSNRAKRRTT